MACQHTNRHIHTLDCLAGCFHSIFVPERGRKKERESFVFEYRIKCLGCVTGWLSAETATAASQILCCLFLICCSGMWNFATSFIVCVRLSFSIPRSLSLSLPFIDCFPSISPISSRAGCCVILLLLLLLPLVLLLLLKWHGGVYVRSLLCSLLLLPKLECVCARVNLYVCSMFFYVCLCCSLTFCVHATVAIRCAFVPIECE